MYLHFKKKKIDKLVAGPKRDQKWRSVVTFDPFVPQTCALYFWKWQKISEWPTLHPDRGLGGLGGSGAPVKHYMFEVIAVFTLVNY